jgi:multiple sugar transport system substrate-binding protein
MRVVTLALAAALATSAAVTAQEGSPAASDFDWQRFSGSTITFLANQHPWTDGATPLVEEFQQATGITVDVQPYSEDLYFDKMEQVVRAAEGEADVYFLPMDSTAYGQYLAGAVAPISPYLADPTLTSPDYDFADFPAGFLGGATFPPGDAAAQVYGVPIAFEAYILFANKDLVDQYLGGVMPTTFDELTAAAALITEQGAASGVSGSVMRGIRSDTVMDTLSGVVFDAFGDREAPTPYGMWFDGDWSKPRLDDPAICQGLTNYARLLAAGPSNRFDVDWDQANALFQQGKVAFFIDASLFGPSYEDPNVSAVAGKVAYAALPPASADGSRTGHWLWGLGIPANSANKEAAWFFIQWMTNKANTSIIGGSTGGAPRLSSYQDPVYTDSLVPEYVSAVNEAMATSRTTVVLRDGWRDGALAIVDGMQAIANGGDPTASCAAANEALAAAMGR